MANAPNPWDYADRYKKEHAHQAALFMWANMAYRFGLAAADDKRSYSEAGFALANQGIGISQLKWLHAIHNQGHGDLVRGARAKAEGLKAGVFDLFLPVPMQNSQTIYGVSYGLYIEMKVDNNKPSEKQLEFKSDMETVGYKCEIAYGWLEARKIILDYLGIVS